MYSRKGEAVGMSDGRVWVVFWNSMSMFTTGLDIWKDKWARLGSLYGVCGIGGMTRYERCCKMDLCGYLFLVLSLELAPLV